MMTRIHPDEVPLRKTLNPHQLQAAGVLFSDFPLEQSEKRISPPGASCK